MQAWEVLEQHKKDIKGIRLDRMMPNTEYLTTFLANFFPNPGQVILGISELLINAIEHGNLGITYGEKTEFNVVCRVFLPA